MPAWSEPYPRLGDVLVRRPGPDDADAVFAILTDPRGYPQTPERRPVSREETDAALALWLAHWDEHGFGFGTATLAETGEVVGIAGVKHHAIGGVAVLELFYRLHPDHWGRGLATQAAMAVVWWAQLNHAELPVIARVADDDARSAAVAGRVLLRRIAETDPGDPTPHALFGNRPLTWGDAPADRWRRHLDARLARLGFAHNSTHTSEAGGTVVLYEAWPGLLHREFPALDWHEGYGQEPADIPCYDLWIHAEPDRLRVEGDVRHGLDVPAPDYAGQLADYAGRIAAGLRRELTGSGGSV